ncbi:hypothetical protein K6L44_10045 [Gluconacetobacter entanii]|uniref:hypothetical protein n=1 Tax=Gluconacetobacter entanii TaxID=108528 RepID=UPI001C9356DD|nr:hypothetical protein [Gluconacetobacter entanii]MBY4640321.1 hypothetical protein [Gluconacetobacter entanii]MCW4579905.1 hypothetical protein [Gluconacetobacter entanii]MCW4584618.1 hypothetical protein [Gluconacetobacter entanii]MCW4588120.1 hypothetical protein [Gluconacetobacter entanii]
MNDTTKKGIQQMPHREIPLPAGAGSLGGRKIDLLELAEEAVSLLCSDILREICTTERLTTATYETVLELSVARGALAEMIGIMHPEVSIEQLAEGMEPQGMKLPAADFCASAGVDFGSDAAAVKEHADCRAFVKAVQDAAQEKSDATPKGVSMQPVIDELNIWRNAYCGCRGLLMDVVRMLARNPLVLTSMISMDEKTVQRVMRLIASPHAVADILTAQVDPECREKFSNALTAEMRISGWPEADVSDADA